MLQTFFQEMRTSTDSASHCCNLAVAFLNPTFAANDFFWRMMRAPMRPSLRPGLPHYYARRHDPIFHEHSPGRAIVLQAATLASSGDVYMLDMGEPVKIVEFARDLIRMSGLRPDIDIPIQFTGIRPGEKLHEQLWYEDAEVSDSPFPYVFRVKARKLTRSVAPQIAKLEKAAAARASHEEIYSLLRALPIDYARVRSTSAIHPLPSTSVEPAIASGGAD